MFFFFFTDVSGVQYHPELKSRPNRPSPPLFSFAAAACGMFDSIGKAGTMWREYEDEGGEAEAEGGSKPRSGSVGGRDISWVYSPASGLKKKQQRQQQVPGAALQSPEKPVALNLGAPSVSVSAGVGSNEGASAMDVPAVVADKDVPLSPESKRKRKMSLSLSDNNPAGGSEDVATAAVPRAAQLPKLSDL
jgi:hypothetical protein